MLVYLLPGTVLCIILVIYTRISVARYSTMYYIGYLYTYICCQVRYYVLYWLFIHVYLLSGTVLCIILVIYTRISVVRYSTMYYIGYLYTYICCQVQYYVLYWLFIHVYLLSGTVLCIILVIYARISVVRCSTMYYIGYLYTYICCQVQYYVLYWIFIHVYLLSGTVLCIILVIYTRISVVRYSTMYYIGYLYTYICCQVQYYVLYWLFIHVYLLSGTVLCIILVIYARISVVRCSTMYYIGYLYTYICCQVQYYVLYWLFIHVYLLSGTVLCIILVIYTRISVVRYSTMYYIGYLYTYICCQVQYYVLY